MKKLISLAVLSVAALSAQAKDIVDTAVAAGNFKTLAKAQDQLVEVRAEVFRTLALIASMDEAKVKAVRADLAKQVQDVQQAVQALPAASAGDAVSRRRLTWSGVRFNSENMPYCSPMKS